MRALQPITVENAARLTPIGEVRAGFITQLAWSPDGKTLAVSTGGGLAVWKDGFGGPPDWTIQAHSGPVKCLAFSPDGYIMATGGADMTVRMSSALTGDPLTMHKPHTASVEAVAFRPDGAMLATGSADHTIQVLDMRQTARRYVLTGHTDEVTALVFTSHFLASGSRDATVRLWDETEAYAVLRGHTDWVRDIAITPDNRLLASASRDASVRLWDTASGDGRGLLAHQGDSRALAFSRDGKLLAADDAGKIRLWDIQDQREIKALEGHSKPVLSLAFHPNGQLLASGSGDNTIRLWGVTP